MAGAGVEGRKPADALERGIGARGRIVQGAARCVAAGGAAALSLNEVAREAGVSKSLILYHFADKDDLLATVVRELAGDLVARERAALASAEGAVALDAYWAWLDAELRRGEIRTLLELGRTTSAPIMERARVAAIERRTAAAASVSRLFAALGLVPRVPPPLLGNVLVAFIDGLALEWALDGSREARPAFDVFWLALLSLAE